MGKSAQPSDGSDEWLPAPEATVSIARQPAACCSAGTQPDPATRHALAGLVSMENRVHPVDTDGGQCLIVREGQLTYRSEPITHIGSSHD